jgi:hypothetical protein
MGTGPDDCWPGRPCEAPLPLDLLSSVWGVGMPIDRGSVRKEPQPFGRVPRRRVERRNKPGQPAGHADLDAGMPSGAAQHRDDLLAMPRAGHTVRPGAATQRRSDNTTCITVALTSKRLVGIALTFLRPLADHRRVYLRLASNLG